jgi:uncharacterized YigZ family protein
MTDDSYKICQLTSVNYHLFMIMEEQDYYYTVETTGSAEFKDRGSKFIAHAYPVKNTDECKEQLNKIKKQHPKATHHCFAYRIGLDGNNFRVSDDGEPSGTAGRPILGQLDSKRLTNTLVIVVRYFGGTLLGVPGLINAYKSVTALVLQTTQVVQKMVEEEYHLHFDYMQMNEVMTIVKQYQCRIIEQEMQLFCKIKIAIPKNREHELRYKLGELRAIELTKVK